MNYNQFHNTYEAWLNRPIELLTINAYTKKSSYKKHLLLELGSSKEDKVMLRDLSDFTIVETDQNSFHENVRLIQLGNAPTISLTNEINYQRLFIDENIKSIEFFIIQLRSHFGKSYDVWSEIAKNITVHFTLKSEIYNSNIITDKIELSALLVSQKQPVFNFSKIFEFEKIINLKGSNLILEIKLEKVKNIKKEFKLSLIYNKCDIN